MRYENIELESLVFEKATEEFEARKLASERISFIRKLSKRCLNLLKLENADSDVSSGSKLKHREGGSCTPLLDCAARNTDPQAGGILHTNWQVQGYLSEQSDAFERHGSAFPLNAFESILKQLQKLAPELHRVHFLRYLTSLHLHDYPVALENIHRYFDNSQVMQLVVGI